MELAWNGEERIGNVLVGNEEEERKEEGQERDGEEW